MLHRALVWTVALALAACSSGPRDFNQEEFATQQRREQIIATAPHPNFVGTPEWYEWVNRWTGVVDSEGHGPDPGSLEWCYAVNYKVTGFYPDETFVCDKKWERRIDQTLRSDKGLFDFLR